MSAVSAQTVASLATAADLYTDNFLAGFTLPDCPAFAEWQFFQGEELRRACSRLLQQLVVAYAAQEQRADAIRYARRWLALEPLDEAVHRQLMRLYADTGQPAAALRQYEECGRLLAEKLDLLPTAETTTLYELIRTKRFPVADQKTSRQGDKRTGAKRSPHPLPPFG